MFQELNCQTGILQDHCFSQNVREVLPAGFFPGGFHQDLHIDRFGEQVIIRIYRDRHLNVPHNLKLYYSIIEARSSHSRSLNGDYAFYNNRTNNSLHIDPRGEFLMLYPRVKNYFLCSKQS